MFYPTRPALMTHNFFRRSKLKSVTTFCSPSIDEENKKNRNKIGAKMNMLEAKPLDEKAKSWKRENRLFTSTVLVDDAPRQNPIGTHALRSHRTVWLFSLLKLFFLFRNCHCWSLKPFTRQMRPQTVEPREITTKTAVFQHRWQAWKVVRSIAAVRQRPKTPRTGGVLSLFSCLSFDISMKNSVQGWSTGLQGLFCVKIRKMALRSNDLSTLPLTEKNHQQNLWSEEKSICLQNRNGVSNRAAAAAPPGWPQVRTKFRYAFFHTWRASGLDSHQPVRGKPFFFVPSYSFRPDKRSGKTPVLSCSFVLTSEADSFSQCNFISLFVHSMYSFFIVIFELLRFVSPRRLLIDLSFYIVSYIVLHRFNYSRFRSLLSDRSRYRFCSFNSYRNSNLKTLSVLCDFHFREVCFFRVLSCLCHKSRDR